MSIIKRGTPEVAKKGRGRTRKYDFAKLTPGDVMEIPDCNTNKYISIMTSLRSFKHNQAPDWETTTRFNNNTVFVYRLK